MAARVAGSYNMLITQRLILQPQLEMNFYNKDDPARGLGSGISDLDSGLRLRYESREKSRPISVSPTPENLATPQNTHVTQASLSMRPVSYSAFACGGRYGHSTRSTPSST